MFDWWFSLFCGKNQVCGRFASRKLKINANQLGSLASLWILVIQKPQCFNPPWTLGGQLITTKWNVNIFWLWLISALHNLNCQGSNSNHKAEDKKKKFFIFFLPCLIFLRVFPLIPLPLFNTFLPFQVSFIFPSFALFSFPLCFSSMPLFKPLQFVLVNSSSRRRMCSTDWGLGGHSCPITNWFINLLQPACIEILFCLLALVVTYSQRGRLFVFVAVHP